MLISKHPTGAFSLDGDDGFTQKAPGPSYPFPSASPPAAPPAPAPVPQIPLPTGTGVGSGPSTMTSAALVQKVSMPLVPHSIPPKPSMQLSMQSMQSHQSASQAPLPGPSISSMQPVQQAVSQAVMLSTGSMSMSSVSVPAGAMSHNTSSSSSMHQNQNNSPAALPPRISSMEGTYLCVHGRMKGSCSNDRCPWKKGSCPVPTATAPSAASDGYLCKHGRMRMACQKCPAGQPARDMKADHQAIKKQKIDPPRNETSHGLSQASQFFAPKPVAKISFCPHGVMRGACARCSVNVTGPMNMSMSGLGMNGIANMGQLGSLNSMGTMSGIGGMTSMGSLGGIGRGLQGSMNGGMSMNSSGMNVGSNSMPVPMNIGGNSALRTQNVIACEHGKELGRCPDCKVSIAFL